MMGNLTYHDNAYHSGAHRHLIRLQGGGMVKIHSLGFPRIGSKRELKIALEHYWQGKITQAALLHVSKGLRKTNWELLDSLDFTTIGDFSLYDQVLDATFLFGNFNSRGAKFAKSLINLSEIDAYFLLARGKISGDNQELHEECGCIEAGQMRKWFDTNYHYIVPELSNKSTFTLNPLKLLAQIDEANDIERPLKQGKKVTLIGPLTYLWLSQVLDKIDKLQLLSKLMVCYLQLFDLLKEKEVDWVQIDEPILVMDISPDWKAAFIDTYQKLSSKGVSILLTTYFGKLEENLEWVVTLPVQGLHIDAVRGLEEVQTIDGLWPCDKVLSIGIIDGRNIWKTDLKAALEILEPIYQTRGEHLWLAPSCSLLHVPVDLELEKQLIDEVKSSLSFAVQKIAELSILKKGLEHGREAIAEELFLNQNDIENRKNSDLIHALDVQQTLKYITGEMSKRNSTYESRKVIQQDSFIKKGINLPLFPTTTIGSFPQTDTIRKIRKEWKLGEIDEDKYRQLMHVEIAKAIKEQLELGIDVLVHGEPERNDMVEYFAEQLSGFAFTQFGWVQSYGSRCVKPPIIFGDVKRQHPITVEWAKFAQSLTNKPVKGMLTGPVTILNWSFVRDDQPREVTCQQIALAIRQEVLALEKSGISIIQIDEAALREGLPLRQSQWADYLKWAIECFGISANGVKDETQIHTHMCYSEFSDIMQAIIQMDADVITIETARSNMSLLESFCQYAYPNEVGPGLYDIHSPAIPSVSMLVERLEKAIQYIDKERLWVNPDCGLKTRKWPEVIPALNNMVLAAKTLRETYGAK